MELEEEIQELEKRFARAPESRLFLPLADALARAGEPERAIELIRKGLESYPDFSAAQVLMGKCLTDLGRDEEAGQMFERILTGDEGNVIALRGLGALAGERGDTGQALSMYEKAHALDSGDLEAAEAIEKLQGGREGVRAEEAELEHAEQEVAGEQVEPEPAEVEAGETGPAAAEQPVEAETAPGLEPEGGEDREPEEESVIDYGDPGEVFITHTLADIYRLQGHFERARRIYVELLEQDPANETLLRELEDVSAGMAGGEPEPEMEAVPVGAAVNQEQPGEVGEGTSQAPADRQDEAGPEAWSDDPQQYLDSLESWLGSLK
ncbi:MAG: tetratricopeptide repeat protein [Gemmatimonadota bacterium]|nr:tetratricopeptide repeat protein [Gemmatimonadota bacterium]